MNFKLLPNWFKKIGLTVFFISFFLGGGDSLMDGFTGVTEGTHHYFKDLFGPFLYKAIYISPIIGMLIYLFSKEKVEDDYIKILRLETFQISTIIALLISFVFYIFDNDLRFSLDYFLSFYLMLYLLVFFIKKRILE